MGREGAVRPAIAGAKDYVFLEARCTLGGQNTTPGPTFCTLQNSRGG